MIYSENFSSKDVGDALNSARVQQELKSKNNSFTSQLEIDLHIEKLIEGFEKMSNAEIINIQLKHFRKKLDEALFKKFHKIVFIHGSGNGRLKNEIRKELDDHQLKYSDGNYAQYGGGATEVHLV